MKIRLTPISPKRISDQVFEQLRGLIFRGEYQPGQKIMTERELAKALNVSRNSVREAINKLVALRFLEQRQGQGTFVRSMDEAVKIPLATVMETQDASLIDLMPPWPWYILYIEGIGAVMILLLYLPFLIRDLST